MAGTEAPPRQEASKELQPLAERLYATFRTLAEQSESPTEYLEAAVKASEPEILKDIDQKFGPTGDDPLAYHNSEHTRNVVRRSLYLQDLLTQGDSSEEAVRARLVVHIAALFHDYVQEMKDGQRVAGGQSEEASAREAQELLRAMNQAWLEAHENAPLISPQEYRDVYDEIMVTEPTFMNGSVMQKKLYHAKSQGVRALAYSDLATAGLEGPEAFLEEGNRLFREANRNLEKRILSGEPLLSEDRKYANDIVAWYRQQAEFARARKRDFLIETADPSLASAMRDRLRAAFDKFDASIAAADERVERVKDMSLPDLLREVGFPSPAHL